MQAEAAHQNSKYQNLNKAFTKGNISREEIIILDDTPDRNSSLISEPHNSPDEYEKTSIAYDSDSTDDD